MPDQAVDQMQPDQMQPDQMQPDQMKPDQTLPPDQSVPLDQGVVGASCMAAQLLTLTGGTVTVNGDTTLTPNEFSGVKCRTSSSSTSTMNGPQAYYKFQAVQDQWYRFVLEPTHTSPSFYVYVFSSATCTKAAIENDCQSDGLTGESQRHYADGDDPRVVYYKAKANGMLNLAVDSTTTSPTDGTFKLTITAIPTPANVTCAAATQMTLTGTPARAVATGDVHNLMTPDEFPTLNCTTSSSNVMDGGQVYYKFDAVANTQYKIKLTNHAGYYLNAYLFGSSCVEADIATDCSSAGVTGGYYSTVLSGPDSGELLFTAPVTGTYTIGIDGKYDYSWGYFTLEVEEFVLPTNGVCTAPEALAFFNGKAVVSGSTLGLTNEYGTDVDCTGYTDYDGPQAYYKLTAKANKFYKIDYTPSFTSYWYIFQASACGTASSINAACGSDGIDGANPGYTSSGSTDTLLFRPTLPGDYLIAVDSSAPTNYGPYQLVVEERDAPTNDTACNATAVTFTNGKATVNGSSLGAINEFGTSSTTGVDCGSTVFDGSQVYYEFTVDATKGYKLSLTPQFDYAYIYVFQKGSCAARSGVDADCGSNGLSGAVSKVVDTGETGVLTFSPTNAGQYVVAIDTTTAPNGGGDFVLEIDEIAKPTNDTCATAEALTLTNGTVTVNSTTGYSTNEYSTLNCRSGTSTSSNLSGPQLYWSLAMDATKNYAITATTSFTNGYLYVFDGSQACSEAAIETDCISSGATGIGKGPISNGSATAYFKPPANGTYKIGIDSYGEGGDVTLKIVEFDPATNQTCATAKTLTLTNGKLTEEGFTIGTTNEFAGLIKCGQTTAFDGGQTYYKLAMTAGQDYGIGLTADHASAYYVFSAGSACTAASIDTDCASGGTTGTFGQITSASGGATGGVFTPAASGDYYIVIDTPTAAAVGGYTLKISEVVANKGLVFQEIDVGAPDYVVLRNNGTTPISTAGYHVRMMDDYDTFASPSVDAALPTVTIPPGGAVYFIETGSTPGTGEYGLGDSIPFITSTDFLAILCNGACLPDGSNVVDVLLAGDRAGVPIPSGLTIIGEATQITSDTTESYQRVSYIAGPPFLSSDWVVGATTRP